MAAGRWVRVQVPATSANLGPGFDTLGLALQWCQEVRARLLPAGLRVRVEGPGSEQVPTDADNLAVRGARAVLQAVGRPSLGLELWQHLALPVGRGLGSSAAAVVGGAVAANALLGGPLDARRIVDLAAAIEGHPDNVAPATLGGICVAAPRSAGGFWVLRLSPPPGVRALAAIPDRPLPTQQARAVLPSQVPFGDAVANVQRTALLVASLAQGRLEPLADAVADRLHQPYRFGLVPGLAACVQQAQERGALATFLSGAGPTVLALVAADADVAPVAAGLQEGLRAMGGGRVVELALRAEGAVVRREGSTEGGEDSI